MIDIRDRSSVCFDTASHKDFAAAPVVSVLSNVETMAFIINLVKSFRAASRRSQFCPFSPGTKLCPPLFLHTLPRANYSTTSTLCDHLPIRAFWHSRLRKQISWNRRCLSGTASSSPLQHTGLYDLHVENNATMVPFGGYSMPLQYADLTISESHHWTRNKASLFDVGHMYFAAFSAFVNYDTEWLNPWN